MTFYRFTNSRNDVPYWAKIPSIPLLPPVFFSIEVKVMAVCFLIAKLILILSPFSLLLAKKLYLLNEQHVSKILIVGSPLQKPVFSTMD